MRPACFPSDETWKAWRAAERERDSRTEYKCYCEDCNRQFAYKMKSEGKCIKRAVEIYNMKEEAVFREPVYD